MKQHNKIEETEETEEKPFSDQLK